MTGARKITVYKKVAYKYFQNHQPIKYYEMQSSNYYITGKRSQNSMMKLPNAKILRMHINDIKREKKCIIYKYEFQA